MSGGRLPLHRGQPARQREGRLYAEIPLRDRPGGGADPHDQHPILQKFFNGQIDIFGNLLEENGGDISPRMEWNRSAPTIGVGFLK